MGENYTIKELESLFNSKSELKGDEFKQFINTQDSISKLTSQGLFFYAFIDLTKMTYQYLSPSFTTLTGHEIEPLMKNGVKEFFDIYKPDVILTQKAIHTAIYEFLYKVPIKERPNYVFCYDLSLKHFSGSIIRILQTNKMLIFDKKWIPLLMLAICHDISNYRNDDKQTLIFKKIKANTEFVVYSKDFYPLLENGVLTSRETEVWKYMNAGYQSKDIAVLMKISLNTVLTHRKRIYKKLRTHYS